MSSEYAIAARLAARQHGRVAWAQLVRAGIDRFTIQRWLADGRLLAVHHGVYAVGHRAPSVRGDYMAAVLACGAGAVLSHRAAAHLLGIIAGREPRAEVTVPTIAGRRRPGIVVHRVGAVPALDASTSDGIPITTAPRVLLDLACTLDAANLARACHEAWVRRTSPRQVEACIARNPTKPGIAKLRRTLHGDVTLSELEDAFQRLLSCHGMPVPRTNVDVAGDKVDCHWPALRLTVELVSYRFHDSRAAFEADVARRRRSNHLAFSYGDVFERGAETIAELRYRIANASKPTGSTVVTTMSSTLA